MSTLRDNLKNHPLILIIALFATIIGVGASIVTIKEYYDKKNDSIVIKDVKTPIVSTPIDTATNQKKKPVETIKKDTLKIKSNVETITPKSLKWTLIDELYENFDSKSAGTLIGETSISIRYYPSYCYINLFFLNGKKYKDIEVLLAEETTFEDSNSDYMYKIKYLNFNSYDNGTLRVKTYSRK